MSNSSVVFPFLLLEASHHLHHLLCQFHHHQVTSVIDVLLYHLRLASGIAVQTTIIGLSNILKGDFELAQNVAISEELEESVCRLQIITIF